MKKFIWLLLFFSFNLNASYFDTVTVDNFPLTFGSTQSGPWSVTANIGTIAGVSTETTLSSINTKLTNTTKGVQPSSSLAVQRLNDSGRNNSNLFMVNQVVASATDTLISLTGYKSNVSVTATTNPAVVTTGKTLRITSITLTYVSVSAGGSAHFSLRANIGGVVAITSPIVNEWVLGVQASTIWVSQSIHLTFPEGIEFAAGTGIGLSLQGFNVTGTAATVGYGHAVIQGYEY
jgi:hypothetical protein